MDGKDADSKLQDAARRSPEVAAMLAGVHHDPGPGYRRIVALLVAAAVGVGGAWFAASRFTRSKEDPRSEPATEIDRSVYLAPLKTEPSAPGEETAPFSGFAVSVDSDPAGAVVTIAGKLRGETPVLANVSCSGAERIEIRATKPGYRTVRRQVTCRADTLVKLTLHLER